MSDKRAKSVDEAAYNHLLVFNQAVQAWPQELKDRLPPFEELYLEPPGHGGRPGPVARMLARLRKAPGPVKLLLTGQKGSGKSWTLQHMAEELEDRFTVVQASATDHSGTTLAEAEISDVLVLLCQALSERMTLWQSLADADLALRNWAAQFKDMRGLPTVPNTTDGMNVEFSAFFARVASRMRSDTETRSLVRAASADDLIIVANALLKVLGATKPVVVLFDDLDKIDPVCARKLFGPQFSSVGRVNARMVLTYPYSLDFENVVSQDKEVLENVQVYPGHAATGVRAEAKARFSDVLGRLVDLSLVEGLGVEEAVAYSGGITREFGRIMARAFEIAALEEEPHVGLDHVQDAILELRVDLERSTQHAARQASLVEVRRSHRLKTELDYALLNENMVVEYRNGHPWYDVHPLLAEVVDSWARPTD